MNMINKIQELWQARALRRSMGESWWSWLTRWPSKREKSP